MGLPGLCGEDREAEASVGDIVQHVGLNLDEVWVAENDDIEQIHRITRWSSGDDRDEE